MVKTMMMSATPGLPEIKILKNKCNDVKIVDHNATKKILSLDSNSIVDVVK